MARRKTRRSTTRKTTRSRSASSRRKVVTVRGYTRARPRR